MNRLNRSIGYLLIGALLAPASLSAQHVQLDITAGANMSTFRGDWLDLEYRAGLALSGTVGVELFRNLRIESGLTWVQMGAKGRVQGFEEPLMAEHRLTYLRVPLHLRLLLPVGSRLTPTLHAGPALAFELSCKAGVEESTLFLSVTDCPPTTGRSEIEWAVEAGAGVLYALDGYSLLLDFTWHHGLSSLQGAVAGQELYNRAFAVSTGFSVPIR